MRLFETNENEAIDSHTLSNNEANKSHCKMYNPKVEFTTVGARERVCTYGIPVVASGLPNSEWGVRGW